MCALDGIGGCVRIPAREPAIWETIQVNGGIMEFTRTVCCGSVVGVVNVWHPALISQIQLDKD